MTTNDAAVYSTATIVDDGFAGVVRTCNDGLLARRVWTCDHPHRSWRAARDCSEEWLTQAVRRTGRSPSPADYVLMLRAIAALDERKQHAG